MTYPKNLIPRFFLLKRQAYVRSLIRAKHDLLQIRRNVYIIAPRTILDLGCNHFKISPNAIGLDLYISTDLKGSALALPIRSESFNTITALELIEHFTARDQDRFLAEIYRVLTPNGQFIVSTPNISEATRKIHDFLFFVSHSIYAPQDLKMHIGELTHFQLKRKLVAHGFEILSEKAFSFVNYVVECTK